GKVAIDLEAGKNLAGAFWQPKLVLMDPDTLDTLPLPVFMEGMAEVVKYGCIWDGEFFSFLEARPSRGQLMAEIGSILYTCCDIKRQVVEADERDTGARMLLNFGHTVGHAYELAGRYTQWSHGAAVAAGMCTAARLGAALHITPPELPARLEKAVAGLGLPTGIPCDARTYAAAVGRDKKGTGSDITVILLDRMGHAVPHRMPKASLVRLLISLARCP
ncbi:MAG: 3-dehydroquinate synthase, partial [Oscillospiraceae bacterium]|nr:3-dehydroquinate synthase [Oscillospiraceae bacterium]